MPIEKLDPKEYRARFGSGFGVSEGSTAYVPKGASTKTILHELWHTYMDSETESVPITEVIDEEVQAEIYARELTDKVLDWRVGKPAIWTLIENYNVGVNKAVKLVLKSMQEHGVPIDFEGYNNLKEYAENK